MNLIQTPSLFVNRNNDSYYYRIGPHFYDAINLRRSDINITDPNVIEIHGPFNIDPNGSQILFIDTMNDFLMYQQQSNGPFVELNYGSDVDEEEGDEVRDIHVFKVPSSTGQELPLREIDTSLIDQIRILCSDVPLTNQIYRRILNILNYSLQPRTVYIYNLPSTTTIDQIRELFSQFHVENIRLNNGVGSVTFVNAFDVTGSVLMLNDSQFENRIIQVTTQNPEHFTLYIYGVNSSETSLEISRLARTFGHVQSETSSQNEISITYDNYEDSVNALEGMNGFQSIEVTRIPRVENILSDLNYTFLYLYNLPNINGIDNLSFIRELFSRFTSTNDIRIFGDHASLSIDSNEANNAIDAFNRTTFGSNMIEITHVPPNMRNQPPIIPEIHEVYVYNVPFGVHPNIFRTIFNNRARNFLVSKGTASMIFDNSQVADDVINEMNGRQYGGNVLEVTRTPPRIRNYPPQSSPNIIYVYNLNSLTSIENIEQQFDRFNQTQVNLDNGTAQIGFSNFQDANRAINTMNFSRLNGNIIHVTRDYPRDLSSVLIVPDDYFLREPIVVPDDYFLREPIVVPEDYHLREPIVVPEENTTSNNDSINLMMKSYETYMRQIYGLPVILPEFLIINGLKVNFIPFSEIKDIQIDKYVIDPILQPWANLPSSPNRIITIFGKNGMTYLVKAKYDQVTNQIFQPI